MFTKTTKPEAKPTPAEVLRRLYTERDELRAEFSDINHQRCQRRQKPGGPEGLDRDVAALLSGEDDVAVEADESIQRMREIQDRLHLVERAILVQEPIAREAQQQADRDARALVKGDHQKLAAEVLAHRRAGRALHLKCLAFERDRLQGCGFGYPLASLYDAYSALLYEPIDEAANDNSQRLERDLQDYLKS